VICCHSSVLMTGIKVPLWDLGIVSLFSSTARMWAGVALLDIHVSLLLQIWSGCWFFLRHPNFPYCLSIQRSTAFPGGGDSLPDASFVFIGMQLIPSLLRAVCTGSSLRSNPWFGCFFIHIFVSLLCRHVAKSACKKCSQSLLRTSLVLLHWLLCW